MEETCEDGGGRPPHESGAEAFPPPGSWGAPPPMADLTVTTLPRDNDDLDGDDDGPGGGSRVSGDLFCDFLFS